MTFRVGQAARDTRGAPSLEQPGPEPPEVGGGEGRASFAMCELAWGGVGGTQALFPSGCCLAAGSSDRAAP